MKGFQQTAAFKRDFRKCIKRGLDPFKLVEVLVYLASGAPLPKRYRDHELQGTLKGVRDCHISPDWLLLYEIEAETIVLLRTGSHTDLFD